MSSRVVVVGGTGNISGALVDALVKADHEVTVFVRGLRTRRLPDGVRVLNGDRLDRATFEEMMRREAFDVAFDMICFTAEDAESDLKAFDAVGHFVHTSTISTFGGPLPCVPANELTPLRPIIDYGRDKVRADDVFLGAYCDRGFPVTVFKPAHTWGPGFPLIRQLGHDPHWINRIRKNKPLLIAGSGQNLWSLCHSDDAVQAYVGVMLEPWAFGETYIVTGNQPVTWLEYHEQVAEALGVPARFVYAPVDAVLERWPEVTYLLGAHTRWNQWFDTTKLRTALPDFEPQLTLRDGLAENVAWMEAAGPREIIADREDEVQRELGQLLAEQPLEN